MAAQVVLELIPDVSKVKAAIDQLGDSGAVSDSSAASFKAGNAEIAKRNALLTQQASIQSKIEGAERKEIATLGQVQKAASAVAGTIIKLSGKEFAKAMLDQSKSADQLIKSLAGVTQEETKQVAATTSLKTEKRKLTEEIARLIAAGEQESATFQKMTARAGEIDDAMRDAQDAIKRTGSDTRGLDNAIAVAGGLAAGFTVATSTMALFGDESEETQKVLLKVNAAMALLNGLQQIQNLLKSEYFISLAATIKAQTVNNAQLAIEVGLQSRSVVARVAATAAQKALNLAMSLNPYGAVAVGILAVVAALQYFTSNTDEATAAQKRLNDALSDERFERLDEKTRERVQNSKELGEAQSEQIKIELAGIALTTEALKQQRVEVLDAALEEGRSADEIAKSLEKNADIKQKLIRLDTDAKIKASELRVAQKEEAASAAEDAKKAAENRQKALADAQKDAETLKGKFKELTLTVKEFFKTLRGDGSEADSIIKDFQQELDMTQNPIEFAIFDKNAEATARQQADNLLEILNRHLAARTNAVDKQAEEEKAIMERLKELAINITAETANAIFDVQRANRDAELQDQIDRLNTEKEYALSTKNLTEKQKNDIQKRYDAETRRLKNEAAKKERKAAIAQAIVNGLLAVTNALATVQPFWAALIAAAGAGVAAAVNVAKISAAPLPAYAVGTDSAKKGYALVGEKGPEIVEFGGGEKVWTATQSDRMMKEWNAANHAGVISDYRANSSMAIDYDELGKAVAKYMPKGASIHNNLDKEGYTTYILQENYKRTFKNQRNRFG